MTKLYLLLFQFIVIISSFSCQKDTDEKYFKGDVFYCDLPNRIDSLKGDSIILNDIYSGEMIIYDTLAFFTSPKYPDYVLSIFNLKNKQHIGNFIQKGRGPNDFLGVNMMNLLIEEKKRAKIWMYAYNEQKIISFDIENAVSLNTSPIDSTFEFLRSNTHMAPFNYIYRLDDNQALVKTQLESMFDNMAHPILPKYQILDLKSYQLKREFELYNKPIVNTNNKIFPPSIYYLSTDQIKPDLKKVVISMGLLSQINILDLESGELKGIRLKGTPSFLYLTKNINDYMLYYKSTTVNNHYIYGLYVNKPFNPTDKDQITSTNEIHVFDWSGNFIKRIILDHKVDNIKLDLKNNILYGKDNTTEDFYRYCLNN